MQKKRVTEDACAAYLEKYGFKKEVAGDEIFARAVKVINQMLLTGLGVFVTGKCGVGKSLFCRIAAQAVTTNTNDNIQLVNLGVPNNLTFISDREYFMPRSLDHSVLLDDVGAESMVNEYGVKHDAVGEFITAYHLRWAGDLSTGNRLFINTNLGSKEFVERYTNRVLSRLKELCIFFKMEGHDKRKVVKV